MRIPLGRRSGGSVLLGVLSGILILLFPSTQLWAQATHLTTPRRDYLLSITQAWGRESSLGDLTATPMDAEDVELRFWQGYGLAGTWGLILRRRHGTWAGWRAAIQRCRITVPIPVGDTLSPAGREVYRQRARAVCVDRARDSLSAGWVITADTVALYPLSGVAEYEAFWQTLKSGGLLELPPRVPRTWMMVDGHTFVIEVRRGGDYRGSVIEHAGKPEVRADTVVQSLGSLVRHWTEAHSKAQ
jgi:hypothetical protein